MPLFCLFVTIVVLAVMLNSAQADGLINIRQVPESLERSEAWRRYRSPDGCVLPGYPKRGNYTISWGGEDNLKPGDWVDNFTYLTYSCKDDLEEKYSVCRDNEWTDTITCIGQCKMLTSTTIDFTCFNSRRSSTYCAQMLPEGTILMTRCKNDYYGNGYRESFVCKDSTWYFLLESLPICNC